MEVFVANGGGEALDDQLVSEKNLPPLSPHADSFFPLPNGSIMQAEQSRALVLMTWLGLPGWTCVLERMMLCFKA